MKPKFKIEVLKDISTVSLKNVSDKIDKDNFDGINLTVTDDLDVGEKVWFVLKLSNKNKKIVRVDEVINYITVPENKRTTKVKYIHDGMVLVEFTTPEKLTSRIGLDLFVKNMDIGKHYFNTQYLENCYTTYRDNEINTVEMDLEIYPYPDYELVSAEYEYNYFDTPIKIVNNKAILKNFVIDGNIFLKGKAVKNEPLPSFKVNAKEDNYDYTPKNIFEGVSTDIKIIKKNENDVIDYSQSICNYENEYGFMSTKRLNEKTNTFEGVKTYGDVTISVKIEEGVSPSEYVDVTLNLTNCTSDFDDSVKVKSGEPFEITFTADDGYKFLSRGEYIADTIHKVITPSNEDKFTYKFLAFEEIEITLKASESVQVENKVINSYKLTDEQMYELAKIKLISIGQYTEIDYSPFVLKSFTFPLKIDDELMGRDRNIILGNYDTKVVARPFDVNMVDYDLGVVEVPEKYNNLYDYKDVSIRCNLPFSESVELPTHYVIGQSIRVVYTVDFYTGITTVNIYSTYTDTPIHTSTINLIRLIPIFNNSDGVVGQLGDRLVNKLNRYSIEVVRNIPYFVESEFGREVESYNKLNEYTGYIKVEDVNLNSSATTSEKDKIVSLLKNGVKINK